VPTTPPNSRAASRASRAASSPIVCTPARSSAASATGPTPQSIRTGSGASTSCWTAGSTTRSPSGFASSDAILASCLPEPAPTDAGRPVTARTSARNAAANRSTSATWAPASCGGSRKASSSETGSTTGAASASTPMTCSERAW
jgi:hypothetical protein